MKWFMSVLTVLVCIYVALSNVEPTVKAVLLVGVLGFLLGVSLMRDSIVADALLIIVLLTSVVTLQASAWVWFAVAVFAVAIGVRLVLRMSGASGIDLGALVRR